MKIIIDDKIPYIREAIDRLTPDTVYLKGSEIRAADVHDADALIVRTRTRCDEALLGGSSVSFVATATIGFDHIDAEYMRKAGIEWMNCPGCNSSSVAQYVRSVLTLLRLDKGMTLRGKVMGVVGCGHVGAKVVGEAVAEGMRVLVSDPPLQEQGVHPIFDNVVDGGCRGENGSANVTFTTLDVIERDADVITFHVPLTHDCRHATYHLADEDFFSRLRRCPVIINTSRGGVVDNAALLHALQEDRVAEAVIDTWENEPHISLDLLERAWIATPHIAGYSADGKTTADNMVIAGLCRHFNLNVPFRIEPPSLPENTITATDPDLRRLQLYNPIADSRLLKAAPESFEELRGNYPLRREEI